MQWHSLQQILDWKQIIVIWTPPLTSYRLTFGTKSLHELLFSEFQEEIIKQKSN